MQGKTRQELLEIEQVNKGSTTDQKRMHSYRTRMYSTVCTVQYTTVNLWKHIFIAEILCHHETSWKVAPFIPFDNRAPYRAAFSFRWVIVSTETQCDRICPSTTLQCTAPYNTASTICMC